MKPRILDLFCGAGLVHDGLVAAGWEVLGVDINPQRRYPGPFLQHDALTLDPRFLRSFDAIWASPPCQNATRMNAPGRKQHADLIPPTRIMLRASGLPYVIENVMGAALEDPVVLNGYMFGLGCTTSTGQRFHLERERQFEANWSIPVPMFTRLQPVCGVYGAHIRNRSAAFGGRLTRDFPGEDKPALAHQAMGMSRRVTFAELSEGIPPAFAAHIGREMIAHIYSGRIAA